MRPRSRTISEFSEMEITPINLEYISEHACKPKNPCQKTFERERESMYGCTRSRSQSIYSPTKREREIAIRLSEEDSEMWQENEMGIVIKAINTAICSGDAKEKPRIKLLKQSLLQLETENTEHQITNIPENYYFPSPNSPHSLNSPGLISYGGSKSTAISDDIDNHGGGAIKFTHGEKMQLKNIIMQNTKTYDLQMNILLIGDSLVGKTSFMNKFVNNSFETQTTTTLGMDYSIKEMKYKDKNIRFKIWDTNSDKKKANILKTYFSLSDGIIIMYDVTNRDSFESAKQWYESISKELSVQCEDMQNTSNLLAVQKFPVLMFLGNKIDLKGQRVITKQIWRSLNNLGDIFHIEISVRKMKNIEDIFNKLAVLILQKENNNEVGIFGDNYEEEVFNSSQGNQIRKMEEMRKVKKRKSDRNKVEIQGCKCLLF